MSSDVPDSQVKALLLDSEMQHLRDIVEPESSNMLEVLKGLIANNQWVQNAHVCEVLKIPLLRLCARYLYQEKRRGYALNPVGKCTYSFIIPHIIDITNKKI